MSKIAETNNLVQRFGRILELTKTRTSTTNPNEINIYQPGLRGHAASSHASPVAFGQRAHASGNGRPRKDASPSL